MPLTEKQIRLAVIIDEYVKKTIKNGGDDEDLLVSMYELWGPLSNCWTVPPNRRWMNSVKDMMDFIILLSC